jgi:xanthine dehydrogenase YagR molybdenum-binding subunit
MSLETLLAKLNMKSVTAHAQTKGNDRGAGGKFTIKSFGAQFIEIGYRPELARLRVKRVVTVIDGGKIINYAQAKNQVEGAVIMGLGMGLFEEVHFDRYFGNPVNNNLADYVVSSHADTPPVLDVSFLDYPDKELNEYGARGVGEIGLAGVASSICSAVYHATGVRVRNIPVRIEDLLKA